MTIHYPMESLNSVFLSDKFISDKKSYEESNSKKLVEVKKFLNSIEINTNYYRTGIVVKNPRYKKKVSNDTEFIKSFKTSLNKISGINYIKICKQIIDSFGTKYHLYPLIIQTIFEQALLHHNYSKYYGYLVDLFHKKVNDINTIKLQIVKTKQDITKIIEVNDSQYNAICKKNKQNDKLIGYSMFLAELELNNIIKGYSHDTIKSLLNQINLCVDQDEAYKCVSCLYSLWKIVHTNLPNKQEYIEEITKLKSTIKFMKVKFKLMDILEDR